MAMIIDYEKMERMEPREGNSYATVYIKQTAKQRQQLVDHIRTCVNEIQNFVENCDDPEDWICWMQTPLKGFKKTVGTNRSCIEIMNDLINEAKGKKKNGEPKDFALAPIERWNKLFKDSEYEIELEKDRQHKITANLFQGL